MTTLFYEPLVSIDGSRFGPVHPALLMFCNWLFLKQYTDRIDVTVIWKPLFVLFGMRVCAGVRITQCPYMSS